MQPAATPERSPGAGPRLSAKAVGKGGLVRRALCDVARGMGRDAFLAEVRARAFHMLECGGQFVTICNTDRLK